MYPNWCKRRWCYSWVLFLDIILWCYSLVLFFGVLGSSCRTEQVFSSQKQVTNDKKTLSVLDKMS